MFIEEVEKLIPAPLKRLTSAKQEVFAQMLEILDKTKAKLMFHQNNNPNFILTLLMTFLKATYVKLSKKRKAL
ncbi:MAG: hypothetical protein LBH04_12185 [Tannerellaceae bacterium]|jgi:hypothetical protein|nr:hypothetical protein [Tannerellaceae bacterium]